LVGHVPKLRASRRRDRFMGNNKRAGGGGGASGRGRCLKELHRDASQQKTAAEQRFDA